jgi:hypothetical protein
MHSCSPAEPWADYPDMFAGPTATANSRTAS